jgi:D-serine deaminase-like pyridoxal phosphate-dependent protein
LSETISQPWFEFNEVADIPSPALLVYRGRVKENLQRMLAIAGDPGRLRPHIKTHKMREMLDLQLLAGIKKFKCATIAEAELAAAAGVPDLLLAYQPVGPNIRRLAELIRIFPQTKFLVLCDNEAALAQLSNAFAASKDINCGLEVLIDIDVGQHRTGVPAGPEAVKLYRAIASSQNLKLGGLHAYDGHISDADPAVRKTACDDAFAPVAKFKNELESAGLRVPRVVAGGSPTFPFHARRPDVECSPGTTVFWDSGYGNKLRDLDFLPAALVLTRVISKPGPNHLCLDLGHKALGSEMPHPRVQFLNLPEYNAVTHSEEHLVVETSHANQFNIGDCIYGVPRHICPTVALYSAAVVIEDQKVVGSWKVAARERRISI